jgi:hypothetical protein
VPTLALNGSKESWNRCHPEEVGPTLALHGINRESVGNYHLIDEESTQGRGFLRESPAYLCGFRPVRSKFAENPSNATVTIPGSAASNPIY